MTAFVSGFGWSVEENTYRNGEAQTRTQTPNARRTWQQTRSLTAAQADTLRSFYLARRGAAEPFYTYDKKANYDATGTSTVGRYIVRFEGEYREDADVNNKFQTPLNLIEL